ncbi:hypothetical protein [Pseudomonas sp. NPDC087817]|uniref:hypothetical protein n=1 Tax=Pseudomonas sp. NPDC087817 TaxID=3364451 RepID=UPI0038282478
MKKNFMRLTGFSLIAVLSSAQSQPLDMCGVSIPDIPGFILSVKAEGEVCYGELISNVILRPDILTEENVFLIEPVAFEKSLAASGRFDMNGKYIYSYATDEALQQASETGKVDLAHSTASGSAAIRVLMSPFMLWDSEKDIATAEKKFSLTKNGLWIDCFYGLKGVKGATVKFSACVPRSNLKGDPKLSDIRSSFEAMTPSKN